MSMTPPTDVPVTSESVWAIVVAAGTGRRFGGPKQYASLAGQRVLDWSIAAARSVADGLVLVIAPDAETTEPAVDVVVVGADTRSGSVRAGLEAVPADVAVVLVHDAARPVATHGLFRAVVDAVLAGADAAEGVMLPAGKLAVYDFLPTSDPQAAVLRGYDTAYKKAYSAEASTFGGYAYDAFLLIANAVKKTGGVTPGKLRDGIEQARKLVSVSGVFNMSARDHNGLDLSAFEMVRVTRGDWQLLK
jgi:hypothetical protein